MKFLTMKGLLQHARLLSKCMIIAFLCYLSNGINAQHLLKTDKIVEQLSPTVLYEKIDAGKTKVVYSFENKREINPYKVSYDYFITVD